MKLIFYVIATICIVGILLWLSIPSVGVGLTRGPMFRHLNNTRQLQLALTAYSQDQKRSKNPDAVFKIQNLIDQNYIDQEFFSQIAKDPGTYVIYSPIGTSPEKPVARFFGSEGVTEMNLDGSGNLYTWERWIKHQNKLTEQGAAANP